MTQSNDYVITVRYYAAAQAAAGTAEETVALRGGSTVAEVTAFLADRHGEALRRVLAVSSFLLDGVAGGTERAVPTGATVDVLPPFAGG